MIEFGKTLKEAREAKGMTLAQLAEATRILPSTVEDLENENFTRIPAPIYGRGFVKLYCEAVGLDPKPMIAEFMEIFSGNRPPVIQERRSVHESTVTPAPEPEPPSEPEPEPPSEPEPEPPSEPEPEPPSEQEPEIFHQAHPLQADLFGQVAEREGVRPRSTGSSWSAVPRPEPEEPATPVKPTRKPVYSRYAAPIRDKAVGMFNGLSASVWRWSLLGLGALLILWALIAGLRALYRATAEPKESTAVINATGARTPQNIPPLYLD